MLKTSNQSLASEYIEIGLFIINIEYIKNLFTIHHILQVRKSFYKNNAPLSKNCLKRYVFNPFLKPVKDGDLRKSNGSEFHNLGAHTEKALSS